MSIPLPPEFPYSYECECATGRVVSRGPVACGRCGRPLSREEWPTDPTPEPQQGPEKENLDAFRKQWEQCDEQALAGLSTQVLAWYFWTAGRRSR